MGNFQLKRDEESGKYYTAHFQCNNSGGIESDRVKCIGHFGMDGLYQLLRKRRTRPEEGRMEEEEEEYAKPSINFRKIV